MKAITYLSNKVLALIFSIFSILWILSSFAVAAEESSYHNYPLRFTTEVDSVVDSNTNSISAVTYIIGGSDAVREYPWMVALYKYDEDYKDNIFYCGGVLISSRWIATAAHCVYKEGNSGNATAYDASEYSVVIGDSTSYSTTASAEAAGANVYELSNIIIQPNYDSGTYDSDIALLKLVTPYSQPGPALATSDRFEMIEKDDLISTIGFGLISTDPMARPHELYSTTLQEAELPFIQTNDCYWNGYGLMTDNMFCAGYESSEINIDSCSGDSGGPLFMSLDGELSLVGLVSWGSENCAEVPGVYTKISNFRSWILDNISGYQVVEEGTANYDVSSASYTSGLISVYQYGTDVDSYLNLGDLIFDDADYGNTLSLQDSCSNQFLYESSTNEAQCQISFYLTEAIAEGSTFTATLQVNADQDINTSSESVSVSSVSSDDTSSANSVNSGSLGRISLVLMLLLYGLRFRTRLIELF